MDVETRTVIVHQTTTSTVNGKEETVTVSKSYPFLLSRMEERFLQAGGVEKLYKSFRKELFKALVKGPKIPKPISNGSCGSDDCGSTVNTESKSNLSW